MHRIVVALHQRFNLRVSGSSDGLQATVSGRIDKALRMRLR
ncbi:hypothetical protein ISF6_4320 [Piscinibacter sakaiensis]|uniref:Uncharacterized protein n=1 Tax=Piscinibacter sakaiensis TaxID=1547922 RepID=A0A0K8P6A1_PISS1|nr:hypothetical protein ISF6_4320 [Piscinibacter sakaiensis]